MKTKIIILIFGIALGFYAAFDFLPPAKGEMPKAEGVVVQTAREEKKAQTELSFTAIENYSVYDLMQKLKAEGKINFTEKTYTGMGKLIVSINGLRSNGEKTWIYYVNEKKAMVGVSNYKLKPGDVVSWKYEKLLGY